jgi:DNA-binding MltR family transcriptional regulator
MSKGAEKFSLKHLSRQTLADQAKIEGYFKEALGESDRACALVISAALEHSLIRLLRTRMIELDREENEAIFFGDRSPLGTFSSRVWVAYSLGLINKGQKSDLDCIRKVRNAFAHTVTSISFSTKEVQLECEKLKNTPSDFKNRSAKDKFSAAALTIDSDILKRVAVAVVKSTRRLRYATKRAS